MLPVIFVLLVAGAQCAFGNVVLQLKGIQEVPPPVIEGGRCSSGLIGGTWDLLDGGDQSPYALLFKAATEDLGGSKDSRGQALAICQTICGVGEQAYGRTGDACVAAEFSNAVTDGSSGALQNALANWKARISQSIDRLIALSRNKKSIRYDSGPRSNCPGGGRIYRFEAAWDSLFSTVNPFEIELLNEQYCSSKRLYNSWDEKNNLIGATVTACSNQVAVGLFQNALPQLISFLEAVVYNSANLEQAAASAKQALCL